LRFVESTLWCAKRPVGMQVSIHMPLVSRIGPKHGVRDRALFRNTKSLGQVVRDMSKQIWLCTQHELDENGATLSEVHMDYVALRLL
jgi:hypothetical protein